MDSKEVESRLKRKPHSSTIKMRDNRQYIGISVVEKQLDIIFGPFGWETVNFKTWTVINEICGSLDLRVRNPDSGEWVTRVGAAAVQVQMRRGADVLDASSKIKNAMEKMTPKLLSDCTRNAAKKLGNAFGRNIGRKMEDVEPFSEMESQMLINFKQETKGVVSIEAIQEKFRKLPQALQEDADFKAVLADRAERAQNHHQLNQSND